MKTFKVAATFSPTEPHMQFLNAYAVYTNRVQLKLMGEGNVRFRGWKNELIYIYIDFNLLNLSLVLLHLL